MQLQLRTNDVTDHFIEFHPKEFVYSVIVVFGSARIVVIVVVVVSAVVVFANNLFSVLERRVSLPQTSPKGAYGISLLLSQDNFLSDAHFFMRIG